jgi:cephalosporin hydroxylase
MHLPGPFVVDREQPPLSADEAAIVERFHRLSYERWLGGSDTINLSWFGHRLLKSPYDLWTYQELVVRVRPDVVVETGTYEGGSALYFAMLFDLLGHGRVITIDVAPRSPSWPSHPRIEYLTGSSTAAGVVQRTHSTVGGQRAMVVLDSDHAADHVHRELMAYHSLVPPGGYLIVEDTNVNGHPVWPTFGPGPMEAVDRFLAEHQEFRIDPCCERFLMTLNPRGYLRRVC